MAAKIVALLLALCFLGAHGGGGEHAPVDSSGGGGAGSDPGAALRESTDRILAQASRLATAVGRAPDLAVGKLKSAIGEAAAGLDATARRLQRKNPEVERQTEDVGGKLAGAARESVQVTGKVVQQFQENTSGLDAQIKQIFDSFARDMLKLFQATDDAQIPGQ